MSENGEYSSPDTLRLDISEVLAERYRLPRKARGEKNKT